MRREGQVRTERQMSQSSALQLLVTSSLSKSYGDLVALEALDITIPPGQRVALVGRNGSGKSTLLKVAAGLLEPSTGSVTIAGHPSGSIEARATLSYLPDEPVLYDDLSVIEHIEYTCRLHASTDWEERAVGLLDRLGLLARAEALPSTFSRGLRQKTAAVLSLVRPFSLLLVDEPFVGLDPSGREAFVELTDEASLSGAAVVVATHQLDYAKSANRCIVLRDGAVVYDGPPGAVDLVPLVE